MVPLGEVATVVGGSTPASSQSEFWDGDIPWITPAEMGKLASPFVTSTRRTLTEEGLASCSARLLPAGSVILSSRAPIGHLVINQVPMATNQGCKGLIPGPDLDAQFLRYVLQASVPALNDLGTGSTFKEVSGAKVKSFEFPLPPLDEQKRIVAKLDEVNFELKAAETRRIRLAGNFGELIAAASSLCIADSLKDVEQTVTLGSLGQWITGATPPTTDASSFDGDVPFLTPGDIDRLGHIDDTRRTLSQSGVLKSRLVPGPSVNLVCIGATLGKVGWSSRPTATNQQITSIHLDPMTHDPEYLMWRLASAEVQRLLVDSSSTNTIPLLNKSNLMAISIQMPSIRAQKECVSRLSLMQECAKEFDRVTSDLMGHFDRLRVAVTEGALAGAT